MREPDPPEDPASREASASPSLFPSSRLSPAQARDLQLRLRNRVVREAPRGFNPKRVAGADLSVVRGRDTGHAAIVVVDVETLETLDRATASVPVSFPYIPGLLSFRELPPLAAAWARLSVRPDALIFDAHGLAHPRRFGLACHGGLLLGVPSVGAAKSILVGEHGELGKKRGSSVPLIHEGEVVGRVLRTRTGVRPVYVSIGHRMDLATAEALVLRLSPRYRISEPLRRAHRLSNDLRRR